MNDNPKTNIFETKFGMKLPNSYLWLKEKNLIGLEPFSQLQPWHYLSEKSVFSPTEMWPNISCDARLIAFARRQDCDDLASFALKGDKIVGVYVVHAWTPEGYSVEKKFADIWDWLKNVIDEIRDWSQE